MYTQGNIYQKLKTPYFSDNLNKHNLLRISRYNNFMQTVHKGLRFLTYDKQFMNVLLFKGISNAPPHFYNPVWNIIFCELINNITG